MDTGWNRREEVQGTGALRLVAVRIKSLVRLPPPDDSIRVTDEVIRPPEHRRVAFLVHVEIGPPDPDTLRAAFHDVHKAVLFHAAILVEQFAPEVGFPELEVCSGAGGQQDKGAVTGLMPEHELVRLALPDDDDCLSGIEVGMRRTGRQGTSIIAEYVVAHFDCPNSLNLD